MDQKYIIAIEMTGTQIKGAVASVGTHPNGTMALPTIEAIVTANTDDCVQYGRIQNLINAAQITKSVIDRLQNEAVIRDGKINGVYVALAGRSVGSELATAEISLPSEMVITNEILRSLFEEASKMATPNKLVQKVLPRKYVVDNQSMPNPVGALGHKIKGDFTLVTCNPVNRRNLDLVLGDRDRLDINVKGYIVTPLALADMVLDEEDKQLGCALVDIGYQTTTVSIYKDRALQYLATLPMGSHSITRDISAGMNITMDKAENLKCNQGDAMAKNIKGSDEMSRLNAFITARAYELVANINGLLNYAKYKASDLPGGIILAGRGSRLHNLDKLVESQTKMRVKYATMPSNINFALTTNNIRPDDYMSLISMIMRVSRMHDFESCVSFSPKEEEVVIETPVMPKIQTPTTKASQKSDETNRDVDDTNWMSDDDEEETVTVKPQKPTKTTNSDRGGRISFLEKLKIKVNKMVSADDMTDDANLD